MVAIIRRGLFWQVYLTLLGSLILVAVLTAMTWHRLGGQPEPGMVEPGPALGALLPAPGEPRPQIEAALTRLSIATRSTVLLTDAGGTPIATASDGKAQLVPIHVDRFPAWHVRLPDGRSLWVMRQGRMRRGGPHILGVLLIVAAAVGLAAYPVVSRLTGRLERLKSSLDAWGAGHLTSRAPIEGQDEIAAVAASFNAAADRVEALLSAHKALLAHASHELRSPLTRLRMAVEMFLAAPAPGLRSAIVQDIAELDDLVEEILLASRLDQASALPDRERVDCLGLAAEEAARTGAAIRRAGPEGSSFDVEGSPRLLRRLIRNLIENAAKHGQPPVEIELTGSPDGWISIVVTDQGPGIPEAERERVFEPFYRPSGRAEAAGSWGLGLSIVRQIAERHGGGVACEAGPSGGSRFIVRVPAM